LPDADPGQSAFLTLIGAVTEEKSAEVFRLRLHLEERHTNPNGVMHGGVITSLMDEATGGVIAYARGVEVMQTAPHSTVDMNVSFVSSARAGDDLIVEGRPIKIGRSVAFAEAEVRRGDGTIVGKGRFTYVITPLRT
jgi:uncharacterized protein (TIGR00369 family)